MSRKNFINTIAPHIKAHSCVLFPSVSIAQACLESANGTSDLAISANNLFGIKSSYPWTGPSFAKYSWEEDENGKKELVKSDFRLYQSIEESIKDHATFVISTPFREQYYKSVIEAKTPEEQARALTKTYATDSEYGAKLIKIIEDYGLKKYDTGGGKMAYIGIDIGHGINSGPRGGQGTGDEHKFNSVVATKLKKLLEAQGHKVTFGAQQPNSWEVGLTPRTDKFNSLGVDFVISIHANAYHDSNVNGVCGFYWHDHIQSLKLCKAIMGEIKAGGHRIYGSGSIASVPGTWTNLHMVRETKMTSVLMEYGFMTGNKDRNDIFGSNRENFTTQMAELTAKGIQKYLGLQYKDSKPNPNPQGLKLFVPQKYENKYNFNKHKIGDKVTITKQFYWFDTSNSLFMKSNKESKIAGTADKIKKVLKLDKPVGYSTHAYLLDKYNSWILEEHLQESYPVVKPESEEDKPEEEKEEKKPKTRIILKEGQFYLKGKKYQVEEVK